MREKVFSIDYELFGNGCGEIYRDLVYPTNRLLKIFDKLKVKGVFYIEGLEFALLEEAGENLEAVRFQIKEIYDKGHEIGLHIHPQWLVNIDRVKSRDLNLDLWYSNSPNMTKDLLDESISRSLDFIKSCLPGVSVEKFRAGAFACAPSQYLGPILQKHGINIDSSVVPGYFTNKFGEIDFTHCEPNESYISEVDELDFRKKKEGTNFKEIQLGSFYFPPILSISLNIFIMKIFKRYSLPKRSVKIVKKKSSKPIDFGTMNSFALLYSLLPYRKHGYIPVSVTHPKTLTMFVNVYLNILIIKVLHERN